MSTDADNALETPFVYTRGFHSEPVTTNAILTPEGRFYLHNGNILPVPAPEWHADGMCPISQVDAYNVVEELLGAPATVGWTISDVFGSLVIVNGFSELVPEKIGVPLATVEGWVVDLFSGKVVAKNPLPLEVVKANEIPKELENEELFETSFSGFRTLVFSFRGKRFATSRKYFFPTVSRMGTSRYFGEILSELPDSAFPEEGYYSVFIASDHTFHSCTERIVPLMEVAEREGIEDPIVAEGAVFSHVGTWCCESGEKEDVVATGPNIVTPKKLTLEEADEHLLKGPYAKDPSILEFVGKGEPVVVAGKYFVEPMCWENKQLLNPNNLDWLQAFTHLSAAPSGWADFVEPLRAISGASAEDIISNTWDVVVSRHEGHKSNISYLNSLRLNIVASVPPHKRREVWFVLNDFYKERTKLAEWISSLSRDDISRLSPAKSKRVRQLWEMAAKDRLGEKPTKRGFVDIKNALMKEYGTSLYVLFLRRREFAKALQD